MLRQALLAQDRGEKGKHQAGEEKNKLNVRANAFIIKAITLLVIFLSNKIVQDSGRDGRKHNK